MKLNGLFYLVKSKWKCSLIYWQASRIFLFKITKSWFFSSSSSSSLLFLSFLASSFFLVCIRVFYFQISVLKNSITWYTIADHTSGTSTVIASCWTVPPFLNWKAHGTTSSDKWEQPDITTLHVLHMWKTILVFYSLPRVVTCFFLNKLQAWTWATCPRIIYGPMCRRKRHHFKVYCFSVIKSIAIIKYYDMSRQT